MSLFFWMFVGAALGALVLGLILKVRLRDQQVWEELVESKSSQASEAADAVLGHVNEFQESQDLTGEDMNTPPLSQSRHAGRDIELRRSSRVQLPVSLIVLGTNRRGEIFQERTSALSVNLHGCRYSSRHEYAPEGWVTLQVTGTDGANSRPVRARVRSVFSPQTARELCQVGVELESPANVWGISTPPEDWQQLIGAISNGNTSRLGATIAAAADGAAAYAPAPERQPGSTDRKAEVTVFPGPPAATPAASDNGSEHSPGKAERPMSTADQFLQKLQSAADQAVQTALASQLDDAVKAALGKIEEGWKANVRQTEEFSASRFAQAKALWESELSTYRDRAEEVARRIEALTQLSQQALSDSQKFVEHFANETAPQLEARLNDRFARANSDFEARVNTAASNYMAQINENAQRNISEARAQVDEALAQARASFGAAAPADAISKSDFESRLDSLRAETFDRFEHRLDEIRVGMEKQLEGHRGSVNELAGKLDGLDLDTRFDSVRNETFGRLDQRVNEISGNLQQQLEANRGHINDLDGKLENLGLDSRFDAMRNESFGRLDQRVNEISANLQQQLETNRGRIDDLNGKLENLRLDSRLDSVRNDTFARFDQRLNELSSALDQQLEVTRGRLNNLASQLEGLALESRQTRAQHEEGIAEVRSLVISSEPGVSQDQLNSHVNSTREQLHNDFEWRLGEVSGHFEQRLGEISNRINDIAHQLERMGTDTRIQIAESRNIIERAPRALMPQDLALIEQSVDGARRDFENAAARVSDRHLVRLMEQKQVVAQEAALEMEARSSEARALLQKACNSTLDDFRRRVESQVDQILAESRERVASSLASLDAESRATVEARRRTLESDVARAAEQSTAEFRSGIKAFLYSCLVAAVSAVDQHAQTTLNGLSNDPTDVSRALAASANAAPSLSPSASSTFPDDPQFPPKAATNSQ
jgi:hypothetical protein